jgi:hypothetical protein
MGVNTINPFARSPSFPRRRREVTVRIPQHLENVLSIAVDPHSGQHRARSEIKRLAKKRFGYGAMEVDRWLTFMLFQGILK